MGSSMVQREDHCAEPLRFADSRRDAFTGDGCSPSNCLRDSADPVGFSPGAGVLRILPIHQGSVLIIVGTRKTRSGFKERLAHALDRLVGFPIPIAKARVPIPHGPTHLVLLAGAAESLVETDA